MTRQFDIQISFDVAEAIVQTFRDAMLEPSLSLEDTGVYNVRDLRLLSAEGGVLLDMWIEDGRKVRFVLPRTADARDALDRLSEELQRLLKHSHTTYSH